MPKKSDPKIMSNAAARDEELVYTPKIDPPAQGTTPHDQAALDVSESIQGQEPDSDSIEKAANDTVPATEEKEDTGAVKGEEVEESPTPAESDEPTNEETS